jgi:hypothetical protein
LDVFPFEKAEVSPDLPPGNFKPVTQELEDE